VSITRGESALKIKLVPPPSPEESWEPIATAPRNVDVEVRVADEHGPYRLTFPCRLTGAGWINAELGVPLSVAPVAWRHRGTAPATKPH
jgi:hypothetical protein